MAGVLDSVDQRTKLVGQNRLELLLFTLDGKQTYGINVFKVREVLQCPRLTMIPKRNPIIRGVAHIRGNTVSIIDLNQAIGNQPIEDVENSFVIITEYNRNVQGFLVHSVAKIVNLNWQRIHPPPDGSGSDNYLTAVTEVDNKIVEIIDVEKVLSEIAPEMSMEISEGVIEQEAVKEISARDLCVLVADDSSVARKQIQRCVSSLGLNVELMQDGGKALEHLKSLAAQGIKPSDKYIMLISDIEMPVMDGYTLSAAIRQDPDLQDLHIVLHTSLTGGFNKAMVEKAGANEFLAKFQPDDLAARVVKKVADKYGLTLSHRDAETSGAETSGKAA